MLNGLENERVLCIMQVTGNTHDISTDEVLNLTGAHAFKIKFYGVQPFTVVSQYLGILIFDF